MQSRPYNDLNTYLRERFGCRVQKITLDAGLTCPNRDGSISFGGCMYCNDRGSGSGQFKHTSISRQMHEAKEFLIRRYRAVKFLAYFQSFTNTYAPVEVLETLYREALQMENMVGLIIGTRPDCVSDEVLDMIAELNHDRFVTIEYGLQSIHDQTLASINRGHTFGTFEDAVQRTRERGIDVGVHMILGLPGETKDDMLETARVLGGMDIQGIKIHVLYVVRDTPLHDLYESGAYHCLTREEYADMTAECIGWLAPSIVLHRLTGDPHSDELAAPAWALEKQKNLDAIHRVLADRRIVQGCYRHKLV